MIILGIDPGTATTGYGVISKEKNGLKLIKYGTITTPAKNKLPDRLFTIYKKLNRIIGQHKPKLVACESVFFFKNTKTAINVGQARGVVLLACARHKVPIAEITPLQAKQAVACYGRASKDQVQKMVQVLLGLPQKPKSDDAADALACAICAANSWRAPNLQPGISRNKRRG